MFWLVFAFFIGLLFLFSQHVKWLILVLKFVSSVLDVITLPVYLLIDRPWRVRLRSKVQHADRYYEANGGYNYWVRREENEEHEKISEGTQQVQDLLQKVTHLSELLAVVRQVHRGKPCLGRRRVLGRKLENGQLKFVLSNEYEWQNYDQVLNTIEKLANILHHRFQLRRGDRVAIFAGTVPEYFISFWCLQLLGCEVLLMRNSPNESAIVRTLNENRIRLLFTQSDLVKVLNRMKPSLRTVCQMICFRSPYADVVDEQEIQNSQYELHQYEQLLQEPLKPIDPTNEVTSTDLSNGLTESNVKAECFKSTDIALVLSTSGSTGQPKYTLVSHANLLHYLREHPVLVDPNEKQTFLAYLDAATVLELRFEIQCFVAGIKLAYGSMRTYLPDSVALADKSLGDLQASEATIFIGGPFSLERTQESLKSLLRSSICPAIYEFAYEYKKKWTERGFRCRLLDALLFNRLKRPFSRHLELIYTAGAPLLPETGLFLRLYLNTNLTLAYGSTETAGGIALATYDQFDRGNTFIVRSGVQLRLENWSEGGYSVDDRPNARGEIIIGSGSVAVAYFENAEETEQTFFEQNGIRWWRSGDIAEIDERGRIAIVDRKKNLAKLRSAGYFIALGKIEAVLMHCPYVEHIVLHVNSYYNFVTALVCPNEQRIRELAETMHKGTEDLDELYEDEEVKRAVVEELTKFGMANGLVRLEVPAFVKLIRGKWTPENGLLTESLKIRRQRIYATYKDAIDELYRPLSFDLKV